MAPAAAGNHERFKIGAPLADGRGMRRPVLPAEPGTASPALRGDRQLAATRIGVRSSSGHFTSPSTFLCRSLLLFNLSRNR
jgi:hypothetical protein